MTAHAAEFFISDNVNRLKIILFAVRHLLLWLGLKDKMFTPVFENNS